MRLCTHRPRVEHPRNGVKQGACADDAKCGAIQERPCLQPTRSDTKCARARTHAMIHHAPLDHQWSAARQASVGTPGALQDRLLRLLDASPLQPLPQLASVPGAAWVFSTVERHTRCWRRELPPPHRRSRTTTTPGARLTECAIALPCRRQLTAVLVSCWQPAHPSHGVACCVSQLAAMRTRALLHTTD